MNSESASSPLTAAPRHQLRHVKDKLANVVIFLGGLSVIITIALIFFYLVYIVLPLFKPADAWQLGSYPLPGSSSVATVHLVLDERKDIAGRFSADGAIVFFETTEGKTISHERLAIPAGHHVSSFSAAEPGSGVFAYGLDNGQAILARLRYRVSHPNDQRVVTPVIDYPFGRDPITVDPDSHSLVKLVVQYQEDSAMLVALTGDGRLVVDTLLMEESFLGDETSLEVRQTLLETPAHAVDFMALEKTQQFLYLADKQGTITVYDISDRDHPRQISRRAVVPAGTTLTVMKFLTGDISLLIGDSSGKIGQWFLVRAEDGYQLEQVRRFEAAGTAVRQLATEQRRKGFIATDAQGGITLFNTTAQRRLFHAEVADQPVSRLILAPRADGFLAETTAGRMLFWAIDNEHPEVSFASLWQQIWYESYDKPAYIWQSSSASNDFEPKFSFMPLAFGTLKAAFYAMLFAAPLAIMGAIYTAYFMRPRMRQWVKPGIEIMEALPTVILGFLAGLWLAPVVEKNLTGIFSVLLFVPLGILMFAYGWQRLPERWRCRVTDGWEAALLLPVVIVITVLSLAVAPVIETILFDGDMRQWLTLSLGVGFDQRNALIVGLAMGFAVIPTIFSLAEDAIFSVPRHLRNGSLALGATQWQTLTRVVILTASPGIFAAVMIGLGRAIGETMIVLMATGNTPVMDFSIFQGMRTLSANIAVEMPESEVGSSHYRVLFLAALVLFAITFLFNTAAEIIRQRLRRKYSNL